MTGYAVVEFGTTGFHGAAADRIVELAVLQVSESGEVTDEWSTLVNPLREIGPVELHGVMPREILDAPRFKELTPALLDRLRGRIFVGHNALFLTKFLFFRLCSLGLWVEAAIPSVCTMEWSAKVLPGASRRLEDCCARAGVAPPTERSAPARALAVAGLLGRYLPRVGQSRAWADIATRSLGYRWPEPAQRDPVPLRPREQHRDRPQTWLDALIAEMPRLRDRKAESYLACVESAAVLPQRGIDGAKQLLGLAGSLGLDRRTMASLHVRYVDELALAACRAGTLDKGHTDDLFAIAGMLGVPADKVERVLDGCVAREGTHTFELTAGERLLPSRR